MSLFSFRQSSESITKEGDERIQNEGQVEVNKEDGQIPVVSQDKDVHIITHVSGDHLSEAYRTFFATPEVSSHWNLTLMMVT